MRAGSGDGSVLRARCAREGLIKARELDVKLYVGNLSRDMTDAALNELASAYGTPQSAVVVKDRVTGDARGFGFIEYADDEQARAAIAGLNQKEVNGNALKVNEARPSKPR